MTLRQELARVRARVDELEALCAAAYQLAGEVGAPARILDALWAGAQGDALPADEWLPISASECEEIDTLRRQLEAVRRIVAVGPAAAELGRLGGTRTSAAKRRAARVNGRKGGRPRQAA